MAHERHWTTPTDRDLLAASQAGESPEVPATAPENAATAEDGGDEGSEGEPPMQHIGRASCITSNSF
jgi:hypothetical protein